MEPINANISLILAYQSCLRASQVGSITLKVVAVQPLKLVRGQKWIDSIELVEEMALAGVR